MLHRKKISKIIIVMFLFTFCTGLKSTSVKSSAVDVYNSGIGKGVSYTQRAITDGSIKKLVNIVTCDLNQTGSNIIFSKAKDIEKKVEVLSKQLEREVFKGNNVIAGINADMFDMGVGFSSGPQIKDGAILTNHNAKSEENIYPIFGIDKNKKAFITYAHMDAKLTFVGNTVVNSSTTSNGGINNDGTTTNGGISSDGTTTNGAINDLKTIVIDSINRENITNKLVVDDLQLNQNKTVDLSAYVGKGVTVATVVKGISGPIKLGQEYEGVVESLGVGAKSAIIPKQGVLLCSNGAKAEWISNNLKPGDKIKIKISYDKENIADAVGAYTYFVRDGKVLSNDEMIKAGAKATMVKARGARTAIGITADNKVIAITVDSGTPSKGISQGMTFLEMANLLKSLGAINAVGMDGGGSTQMNAKLYGDSKISAVSKPSDGRERALTNAIAFISSNDRSFEVGNLSINNDITIYKNTSYRFRLSGMDTNYNPLDLSNAAINWATAPAIGKINGEGLFTSGNLSVEGLITGSLGKARASAKVKVVDAIPNFKLPYTKAVALQVGIKKQFTMDARDAAGKPIIIDNQAAVWSVSSNIGTIDKNGLLTVKATGGSGVVTAKVGNKTAEVKVSLTQDTEIIDDFEHNDSSRYKVTGFVGGVGGITKTYAKSGVYSYKISYDYDKSWDRKSNGTINLVPTYLDKNGNDITGNYTSTLKPRKLGMWIGGDGNAPWLRAEFTDGNLNKKIIDLAKAINWKGWKYVEVDIPSDTPYPITLNSIYFVETNKELHNKGTVYIDDIKFIYSQTKDILGPTFSSFIPNGKAYASRVNVSVKISDLSGIDTKSLLAKLDGNSITTKFDENTGVLSYFAEGLANGTHTLEVKAADKVGNLSKINFLGNFNVNLGADTVPPVISELLPANNSIVKTATPRMSVKLKDAMSGVDIKDINVLLDGVKISPIYDEASGWTCAAPASPLTPGSHSLLVSAADRSGNNVSSQPITFMVQPIQEPRDPNNFIVSVLSDSNGTEFGNEFFSEAAENASELIIQNGGMVANDASAQWTEGLRQLNLINNKPVMNSPGFNEASTGTLASFNKNFGLSTYSFDYGNSLFISLNSAIGKSISASDPTQFDYLKGVLETSKKQNIFIYTHVPTKDSVGITYAMPNTDAKRLEDILSSYKKSYPTKNINVVFGNFPGFDSWVVNGVTYTIDGNESLRNYVAPENGGFLGYTNFIIKDGTVSHKFVPMSEKIAVVDTTIYNGVMKVVVGTKKKLNLCGDFSMRSADYISPINNIKDVDIKWVSDNPAVVTITEGDGVISANMIGNANIKATVGDMNYDFNITSTASMGITIGGFKLGSSSEWVTSGQSVSLIGYGYDIYGNSFKIDSALINWQASKGVILNGKYTSPRDLLKEDTAEIKGTYKGFTSKFLVKLVKAPIAKKYAKVTASSLNIRDEASPSGKIIGKLKLGDRVEVISEVNGWIKIIYNEVTGYISKEYTRAEI